MSSYLPSVPGVVFPLPLPVPPPPGDNSSASHGGVIAGISIAVGIFLFIISCICSLSRGQRQRGADATADAAAAAAAIAVRPRAPPEPGPWDDHEHQLRNHSAHDGSRPRCASPTAGLPSFTYNRLMKHNVTGSGEEAATCSVCLASFQVGQTVRLLPVCLHLYHMECIDPWLEVHSTCPICRSGTNPPLDGSLLPPV